MFSAYRDGQHLTESFYEQLALGESDEKWELHRGVLRSKPPRLVGQNRALRHLHRALVTSLRGTRFAVSVNASRVRLDGGIWYVPDLCVIPAALTDRYRDRLNALEVYDDPLPLIAEIWAPVAGQYDVDAKMSDYRSRGDVDVWRVDPFGRTLSAWRRRPDGTYEESHHRTGIVCPAALPLMSIDVDELLA